MPSQHMQGENQSAIRSNNLAAVLEAIRQRGPVSRTALTGITHLTASAITNITRELSGYGLIREYGCTQRQGSGRRQVLLGINDRELGIIGLDIARTHVGALLLSLTGKVLHRASCRHDGNAGPAQLLAQVYGLLDTLMACAASVGITVLGIGVGVPGPVDTSRGVVTSPPRFPGWRDVPLGALLGRRFNLPVQLDDDAKAAALGENWFGAGKGCNTMVYLSVGAGIGAGVVLQKRLYRGEHDVAGEIGHVTVDVFGPRCECGNIGCLEDLAAVPALIRHAGDLAAEGVEPGLTRAEALQLPFEELMNPARHPEIASRLRYRAVRYLSAGVILTINVYDPERIIVGGRVFDACAGLLDDIRRDVHDRTFSVAAGRVELVHGRLGSDTTAIGGGALILADILARPGIYFGPNRAAVSSAT